MAITSMRVIVVLIIILAAFAGTIALQVVLSKREPWWPGLILPGVTFLAAAFVAFGLMAFSFVGSSTLTRTNLDTGEVIEERTVTQDPTPIPGAAAGIAYVFLLYNVPTGIYLGIYGAFRGQRRRRNAVERMRAQDLE